MEGVLGALGLIEEIKSPCGGRGLEAPVVAGAWRGRVDIDPRSFIQVLGSADINTILPRFALTFIYPSEML